MIDLLIYLTAKNNNLSFLIFDKTLISFPRSINEDTNMIITELIRGVPRQEIRINSYTIIYSYLADNYLKKFFF